MGYTPEEKARYNAEYYQRNRDVKGRSGSGGDANSSSRRSSEPTKLVDKPAAAALSRVKRLEVKVKTLETALSAANAAYSVARQADRKKARENSDGKATEKQKQSSQSYRDKHKEELKTKAKKSRDSSSSGGSSSSSSSSNSVSEMSSEQLGSRIIKIQSALKDARDQLSSAKQKLGQLAHSAIISDPNVNEHFARFRSERTPST